MSPKKILKIFIKSIKKIGLKFRKKPLILLSSNSTTMDDHIMHYYNQIKDEPYKFKFVFWDNNEINKTKYKNFNLKKTQTITNKLQYILTNPNLIVSADLDIKNISFFDTKKLYINHGTHTICFGEQKTAYSYHLETPKFDTYLESSKITYDYMQTTKYKNNVVYAGTKYSDKYKELAINYEKFRELLGIKSKQKAIFLVGSWQKKSLFHKLGKPLFEKLKELAKNKDYKFIVSIHPNEYKVYDPNIEPLGKYVDELENHEIIVRKPGTDMMPFLIASDLVIADFSSMGDNAVLAGKPLCYTPFSTDDLFFLSIANRLMNKIPTISTADELDQIISKPYSKTAMKEINIIKNDLLTPLGYYKQVCKTETQKLIQQKKS